VGLPDHHYQSAGRAQRPPDVVERGDGVGEEHGAEPADRHVEALLRETINLRVSALEGHVTELLCSGELASTLDRGHGDVDPERNARSGGARGLPRRLPSPAADIEDVVADLDAARPAQDLVMPPQLGIVADGV
jgi:hypothetical protein